MAKLVELNYKVVAMVIGLLLIIEGFAMFLGLPFQWYYHGFELEALTISGIITIVVGAILFLVTRKTRNKNIGKREGYLIVTLSWVVASVFGSLPFMISGWIPNFTDAFFETISGFTTTGASILNDIESLPKGLLFWRSMTHWIGGMGIIVLTVAIFPVLGIGGMQLFAAEMPGPTPDKLHPRITETAKRLWYIYILLTALEVIFLMIGGMDFFESICHSFATVATGGFSTRNSSVAEFSPYIQYVIVVFMFLAGTNFSLHYFALTGQLKKVFKNEEYKAYFYTFIVISVIITIAVVFANNEHVEKAFRDAIFTVISILTTTGFVTANYLDWPGIAWMLIVVLMFIGGSAGSTGGGIKVIRQLLLFKNSRLELKRHLHPQAVIPVKYNGKSVPREVIFKIMAFFLFYIIIFAFGTIIMSFLGLDFETSIGSTAATLGNIGPGIGNVGPVDNFSTIPTIGKWVLSFFMLLGRLELFTVLLILTPAFWRK
ncbi:MAG: TrkH family potassium uptake protein [Hyphomicrobiales bacterium]